MIYRIRGDDEISLGHVIGFPPNPALLTFEANGGMGRSLVLQGYPASPANMGHAACSGVCLQVLRTHPRGLRTTCQLYTSATCGVLGTLTRKSDALPSAQNASVVMNEGAVAICFICKREYVGNTGDGKYAHYLTSNILTASTS
jgi:hypothetical protein